MDQPIPQPDFAITPPVIPPIDNRAKKERDKFKSRSYLKLERYSSDTTARNYLAFWAATVVSVWLYSTLRIICNTDLSDLVKCTLLGTTTLNVLGLMYIVLKGYFNQDEKLEENAEE